MADIYQLLCWQGSWRPRQVAYFIPLIVLGKSLWCFHLLSAGCFIRNNDVCLKMFFLLAKDGCFSSNAEKSRTWSPTGDVASSQRLQACANYVATSLFSRTLASWLRGIIPKLLGISFSLWSFAQNMVCTCLYHICVFWTAWHVSFWMGRFTLCKSGTSNVKTSPRTVIIGGWTIPEPTGALDRFSFLWRSSNSMLDYPAMSNQRLTHPCFHWNLNNFQEHVRTSSNTGKVPPVRVLVSRTIE